MALPHIVKDGRRESRAFQQHQFLEALQEVSSVGDALTGRSA